MTIESRTALCFLWLLWALFPSATLVRAEAAEPAVVVVLSLPVCVAEARAELERALRIELRQDGVTQVVFEDAPGAAAHVHVDTSCDAPLLEARVAIDDALGSRRIEQRLSLDDVSAAQRARVLAVAIAELLRSSWRLLAILEPREDVRARIPAPVLRALALHEPHVAPRPALVRLEASAVLLAFPARGATLFGGAVAVPIRLGDSSPWVVRLGATGAAGSVALTLGGASLAAALGSIGFGYETMVAPSLLFEALLRLDVGSGWASGTIARDGLSVGHGSALLVQGIAQTRVSAVVDAVVSMHLGVSLGMVLAGLDATVDGRPESGIGGPLVEVALGMGFAP